jgi:hypothetical protein
MAAAGGGVVVADGTEAWWYPVDSGNGVRVASFTHDIVDMQAVSLDGDGVDDLLLWSQSQILVLRGRATGGLGFLAGWIPRDGTVAGVFMGRLDEDANIDLLIAANSTDAADVVWLTGDGLGAWTPTAVLSLDYEIAGATAEDFDGNGQAEVTVITPDGVLRRYDNGDDGWLAASQTEYSIGIGEGSRIIGGVDLTRDDQPDILQAASRSSPRTTS